MVQGVQTTRNTAVLLIVLLLVPAVTGLSVDGSATQTILDDTSDTIEETTETDAESAVDDARSTIDALEETVKGTADTVNESEHDKHTDAPDVADDIEDVAEDVSEIADNTTVSEGALDEARDLLEQAEAAFEEGDFSDAVKAANAAQESARTTQEEHAKQRMNETEYAIHDVRTHRALLAESADAFSGHTELDTVHEALAESEARLNAAESAMSDATAAMEAGNLSAADQHITEAETYREQAVSELQTPAIRTELDAGIGARLNVLAEERNKARIALERAKRYGDTEERQQARQEYQAAQESYEQAEQNRASVNEAETMEDIATTSNAAATTLNDAERQIASAQEHAHRARSVFYRNALLVAAFLAVFGGSGFLYYRMNGDYLREKRKKNGKTATEKTDGRKQVQKQEQDEA